MEFVLWVGAYLVAGGFVAFFIADRLLSDSDDGFLGLLSGIELTGAELGGIILLLACISLLWPIMVGILILFKVVTTLILNPLAERINKRHST